MDFRPTVKILSNLLMLIGIAMGITAIVAHGDSEALLYIVFRNCSIAAILIGTAGVCSARRHHQEKSLTLGGTRDGYLIVALSWVIAIALGALPFIFGAQMRLSDAIFETTSGLTTCGASVIDPSLPLRNGLTLSQHFAALAADPTRLPLPDSLLLWRAILNWLGGCGIIFFVLLVVPFSTFGKGVLLYNAEVPGLKNDEPVVRTLKDSIYSVTCIYVILTAVFMIIFHWGGMSYFDAVCHALSTVSTGGFSTKSASIGYYSSPFIQWAVTLCMMISACNFTQLLMLFVHRRGSLFKDEEFRCFIGCFIGATVIITTMVYFRNPCGLPVLGSEQLMPRSVLGYARHVAFQLATCLSTTGFVTSDWELWHSNGAVLILVILMFPCGCGGSTAGGMKFSRIVVAMKHLGCEIRHCIFPHAVADVRFNGSHLSTALVSKTLAFIILYFFIWGGVAFLLLLLEGGEINIATACGASISALSNVGPGLGRAGASGNFSWMTAASKSLLSLTMVTGRLEIYTILVLFIPSFWRR